MKRIRIGKTRSSRIRLGRSIMISVALAATAGSSVAMALRSARQGKTIPPGSFGTAVAKCRGRRTVVSGGFAAPGFDPSNGPTIGRLASKRHKHRIETRAVNFGNQAGDLVSFAYCALHDHGLRVRTASAWVKPNSLGSAVARCPGGTEALGGGFGIRRFSMTQGPQVITLTSKLLGKRRWKVVAVNFNGTRAGKLIAHAYCEDAPFKLVTRSKDVTLPTGALKALDVRCPNGYGVFSGGFDGHVKIQGIQSKGTTAVTSRRASGGHVWRTLALNVFDPNPGSMTAYAYCRER